MRWSRALVAAVVFVGVVLPALAETESVVELVDQAGTTVRIEGTVERIASVYGIGTFFLYALGARDRLVGGGYVGVKSVAQASEAMLRLEPRFEDLFLFGDPNVEEILRRDPQLVLADASRHGAFAEQMLDLGIPTIQYVVESVDALHDAMRLTGEALGGDAGAKAERFRADFDRLVETIDRDLLDLAEEERVRVLFIGTAPLQVVSGEMYQAELIGLAGGRSVSSDLIGYWNEVNLEQILLWDPDVIVIAPYGPVQPSDLVGDADWSAIGAVRSGRVHKMPRLIAPMDTPAPESLLGLAWLSKTLFPERVSLDLRDEAVRFYEDYYAFTLTDDELDLLAGD
jgi:iron complex transport system substrate-binding protein